MDVRAYWSYFTIFLRSTWAHGGLGLSVTKRPNIVFMVLLKLQLRFACNEVPGQLENAVSNAEQCSQTIKTFITNQEHMSDDISNYRADVSDVTKHLTSLHNQILELNKYSCYLRCLSKL